MFEQFPYADLQQLNLDWIIKIAKDFLDQYTQIQEIIHTGEESLQNITETGLEQLQDKATELEGLLQDWYDTHSQDIANALTAAVTELNTWMVDNQDTLDQYVATAIDSFTRQAEAKAAETIESIPADYTALGDAVALMNHVMDGMRSDIIPLEWVIGSIGSQGQNIDSTSRLRTAYMNPCKDFNMVYIDVTNAGQYKIYYYDENQAYLYSSSDWTSTPDYVKLDTAAYFKIIAKYTVSADLQPEDISNILTVKGFALANYSKFVNLLPDGTDLDTLYSAGWYQTYNLGAYGHTPADDAAAGHRIILVYTTKNPPLNTSYRVMFYYNDYTNYTAIRFYYSGEWHEWKSLQSDTNLDIFLHYKNTLADGSDLDDIYLSGWYETIGAGTYLHAPEPDGTIGARLIVCYNCRTNPNQDSYRIMTYFNNRTGIFGIRYYYSSTWHAWKTISLIKNPENNILKSFMKSAQPNLGENNGLNLVIGSYNVATYKNETETYIPAENIRALRKFLGMSKIDIMACQEDRPYIDENNQESSTDYIYQPVIPASVGVSYGGCTLRSRARTGNQQGRLAFTQHSTAANHIVYATFEYNDITLLMVGVHTNYNHAEDGGTSEANQAIRLSQYQDVFKWVSGVVDLEVYGSSTETVHVPNHTHCIICGDFNTYTDNDQDNLSNVSSTYNFRLANGGRFGWFVTHPSNNSTLDNIVVSDNIIINDFNAWSTEFVNLYSDHVPITADVTLL